MTINLKDGDAELNLPGLKTVKGNINISSNTLSDLRIVAPLLETVKGDFFINLEDGDADLDLRGLEVINGDFNIAANNLNNLSLNLVNLEKVYGQLKVELGAGISMPNSQLSLDNLKYAEIIDLNILDNNIIRKIWLSSLQEVSQYLKIELNTLTMIKLSSLDIVKNIYFNIENELNGNILVSNLKTVSNSLVLQGNGIPYEYADSSFHPLLGNIESIKTLVLYDTLLETLGYNDGGNYSHGLQSLTNVSKLVSFK